VCPDGSLEREKDAEGGYKKREKKKERKRGKTIRKRERKREREREIREFFDVGRLEKEIGVARPAGLLLCSAAFELAN